MLEEDFTSAGGVRIHMRSWEAEGAPRAVVVICHGVNSHGGQHAWTAEQLTARGFAVFAVDLRGRGKSEGDRFYVEDIADYVAHIRGLIGIARERKSGSADLPARAQRWRRGLLYFRAGLPRRDRRPDLRELRF